ncbi:anti-sigma-I factor RsgI2-like isoform X5 [Dendropsophus ebraccatus]|uniref:anti-sigma-I factor RsgI2-like isoform X5 n=1 Tax=Dendropsophus ebraccatus TaxID=150705 RepID=UPI003831320A
MISGSSGRPIPGPTRGYDIYQRFVTGGAAGEAPVVPGVDDQTHPFPTDTDELPIVTQTPNSDNADLQDMTPIPEYDKIPAMTPAPADDGEKPAMTPAPADDKDLQDITPVPDYDEIPDMTLAPADDGDSPDITPVPDYYDLPDITPVPDYDEIPAMTPAPAGDGELPTITPAPADHEGLKSPAVTPPPSPTSPTSPASLSLSDDNSSILTDKIKGAFIAAVIVVFMIAAVICIVKVFRIKPSEPTIV